MKKLYIFLFSFMILFSHKNITPAETYIGIVENLNIIGTLLTKYNKTASKELFDEINVRMHILKEQNGVAFENISIYCKAFFDTKNSVQESEMAYNDALAFIRTFTNKVFAGATDQLEKNIINLEEQEAMLARLYDKIDILVAKKIISQKEAALQKTQLKSIFDANKRIALEQASYVSQLSAKVKSPFKWAYNKVFDQDASYLQRAAYAAVVAAGTIAVGAGIYYGLSAVKDWWSTPSILPEAIKPEIMKALSKEQSVEDLITQSQPSKIKTNHNEKLASHVKSEKSAAEPESEFKSVVEETPKIDGELIPDKIVTVADEKLKKEEYEEFEKFVRRYAPPEDVKKTITARKAWLKDHWTGLLRGVEGSPDLYVKGDDISRIINAERIREWAKEKGVISAPDKYFYNIGDNTEDEWRVFAKKITQDPMVREWTPLQAEELNKFAKETGFSDFRGNLKVNEGKVYIIDTEDMSFTKNPLEEGGLSLPFSTKYDNSDIDFEKVKDQFYKLYTLPRLQDFWGIDNVDLERPQFD